MQLFLSIMLTGGLTVIVWKNIESDYKIFELYELAPGFIFALLAILLSHFFIPHYSESSK
ncbi:MAG: hypothetical protein O7D86_09100 [Proteobacteria bacterium]|nr:hypothetical protein [Pseudomonadota bacterium]